MKITKLEYQKKDPNRVNVYVDGKFVVGLDVNEVIRLGIYNGQELSQEQLEKFLAESEFGKLFNASLNFLSFRPRSEWEIRNFLSRKQIQKQYRHSGKRSEASASRISNVNGSQIEKDEGDSGHFGNLSARQARMTEEVIAKLVQIGQINDENFAKWFIEQRRTFRVQGRRAIRYELLKKGVKKEMIEKAMGSSKNESTASELDLALKVLNKKAAKMAKVKSEYEAKVKLQQFLMSRGFDFDTAREAVEKFLKKE